MSASRSSGVRTSPYKGLNHYGERDARYFFGRESETAVIAANLLASRLTLLYGASGVGKSSLLRAGVASHLRDRAAEDVAAGAGAQILVVTFPPDESAREEEAGRASWRDDVVAGIAGEIERAAALLGLEAGAAARRPSGFVELIDMWSQRLDVDILLVLDQFEEFFLYHDKELGDDAFVNELPRALVDTDLRANVLISIRDDAYARLDRFKGRIPFLYDNYLRVDHLDVERARDAIVEPLLRYGVEQTQDGPVSIEPALVDAVLDQVRTGRLALVRAGVGLPGLEAGDTPDTARVETPFLQLVMERLWDEEVAAGSKVLRRATLDRLGGADRIVRTHLDEAMNALDEGDRDVAARAFRQLVTPSGTKIAHLPSDIAAMETASAGEVTRVLRSLAEQRVLRPVAPPPGETNESRYEIFHDVLGPAVLDWRARYEQAREHELEQRRLALEVELREREREDAEERAAAQHRNAVRFRALAAGAAVLAVAAVLFAVQARHSEKRAGRSDLAAQAAGDVTRANLALATDPARALRAAISAADRVPTPDALLVLRRAARASNLVAVLRTGTTFPGAAFSPDGARVVTADSDGAAAWSTTTGGRAAVDREDGSRPTRFLHDARGDVATAYASGFTSLWTAEGGKSRIHAAAPLVLSPNGRYLAVRQRSGIRVERTSDGSGFPAVASATGTVMAALADDGTLLFESPSGGPALSHRGRPTRLAAPRSGREVFLVVVAVALSDDGKTAAVAWDNGTVRVYGARTGRWVRAKREPHTPTAIAFAPDGRLAVGNSNGGVSLWNWRRDTSSDLLGGHDDAISAITFSRTGGLMATASADTTARIWNARTGGLLAVLAGHTDGVTSVAFSGDATRVATTSSDRTARVWRTLGDAPEVVLPPHRGSVGHAIFSGDGRHVLTSSADRSVILAPASGRGTTHTFGKPRRVTRADQAFAHQIYFAPNSDLIVFEPRAAVDTRGTRIIVGDHVVGGAELFDVRSGAPIARVVPRGPSPNLALFGLGPRRRWAAVTASPNAAYLFDARTGERRGVLKDPPAFGHVVPFGGGATADGRFLLLARWPIFSASRITLWNVSTRKLVQRWSVQTASRIRNASIDPTGRYVAASNWAGDVWIWQVSDGKRLHRLDLGAGVRTQEFSPDGSLLALAGDATSAGIWDVRSGTKVASLRGHTAPINHIEFSHDGRLVTTASDDGTARIWDARAGDEWIAFREGRPGRALYASLRGRRVVISASDGSSAIYVCAVCGTAPELLEYAKTRLPVTP